MKRPIHRPFKVCVVILVTLAAAIRPVRAARACVEGESAGNVSAPMRIVNAASEKDAISGASGRGYLEIRQGAGDPPEVEGRASVSFEIPEAGRYHLWCRVRWVDGCGNSLGMRVGDAPVFTFGQDGTYKRWHWVKAPGGLRQLDLAKGTHTLTILHREDGVALDQILFVTQDRYVPVGI